MFDSKLGDILFAIGVAVLVLLCLSGCTTTRQLPPPAPEAVKVLVPVVKPCVPAKVAETPKPIDDPKFGELGFVDAVKGILKSALIASGENTKLRAANDRPCGDDK